MRIKQWGLDKKNKENEMRAIVHKNKQRSDQGKRSVYRTRDRQVDYADVVRYFNRKKYRLTMSLLDGQVPRLLRLWNASLRCSLLQLLGLWNLLLR